MVYKVLILLQYEEKQEKYVAHTHVSKYLGSTESNESFVYDRSTIPLQVMCGLLSTISMD